jgi:hypothetical protein
LIVYSLDGKSGKNNFKNAKKMCFANNYCHLRLFWVNFVIFFEKKQGVAQGQSCCALSAVRFASEMQNGK